MGWLLLCNTGSLRKHKPFVPCSVSLSNNYVIVKAFSKNITGSTNLAFSKKVNLQVPVRFSFQGLPLFLGKEKSVKCTYFGKGSCSIYPPLIFTTQRLIISPQHIKLCISLFSQSLWTFGITWCHERSSINSESYLRSWSIKTLILSSLRR